MSNRVELDARGQACPTPTLRMTNAVMTKSVHPGDTLVIYADCPTFEADVKRWCQNMKRVLIVLRDHDAKTKVAEVRV